MAKADTDSGTTKTKRAQGTVIKNVRRVVVLFAAVASTLPGLSFFNDKMPPMWPQYVDFGAAVAIVFFLIAYWYPGRRGRVLISKRSARIFFGSIAVCIAYLVFFHWTTASPPGPREGKPIQIGFGMMRWSLTSRAIDALEGKLDDEARGEVGDPPDTPTELLKTFGVWGDENPVEAVWTRWSIYLAGAILIVVYLIGLVLWSFGVGTLARVI